MLGAAIDKVKEIGYNRCGKCPAYWASVDYWGEADAGCTLHRDYLEFCPLSLLPQFVMKPYVKLEEWREGKRWDKIYEEESAKWEQEEADHEKPDARNQECNFCEEVKPELFNYKNELICTKCLINNSPSGD